MQCTARARPRRRSPNCPAPRPRLLRPRGYAAAGTVQRCGLSRGRIVGAPPGRHRRRSPKARHRSPPAPATGPALLAHRSPTADPGAAGSSRAPSYQVCAGCRSEEQPREACVGGACAVVLHAASRCVPQRLAPPGCTRTLPPELLPALLQHAPGNCSLLTRPPSCRPRLLHPLPHPAPASRRRPAHSLRQGGRSRAQGPLHCGLQPQALPRRRQRVKAAARW